MPPRLDLLSLAADTLQGSGSRRAKPAVVVNWLEEIGIRSWTDREIISGANARNED